MLINFFRTIFFIFITTFIFFIGSLIYFGKKIFSKEFIKYSLINNIYSNYALIANFQDIEYNKPDNFTIKNLNLFSKDLKIFIKTLSINIDIIQIIKNKNISLNPRSLEISSMEIKYTESKSKKINYHLIKDLFKFFSDTKVILIKDSNILINKNDNKHIIIEIEKLQASGSFFSDTIEVDLIGNYIYDSQKINLNSAFEIEDHLIKIKKLDTKISSKDIKTKGLINLKDKISSELELKIDNQLDIKEIVNIPYSIKINPFISKIKGEIINNKIVLLKINIPSLNTDIDLNYDYTENKFNEINIKSTSIDYNILKEYIDSYIKNFKGKINLDIKIKPDIYEYKINAESNNFSFKDLIEAINFKNTHAKLIITKTFHSLNVTQTTGVFPFGKITGNFQIEGNDNLEKIKTNLKINGNYLNSDIYIEKPKDKENRNYSITIKTQNFSFQKMMEIYKYIKEKSSKYKYEKDSIYNFIDRQMKIKLVSFGYEDEPYINAKKILINANYKNANEILKSDAEFKIRILEGQIKDIQKNIKQNKIYELILLPVIKIYKLNRIGALKIEQELNTINFSDMGSYFKANNAKIIIEKFYLNSFEFLIYSRGEIDFSSKKINMNVYVINKKDFKRGALPETLTDAKGRPSLAFNVYGSFEKNEIKIIDATNTTELVESEVKKALEIEE
ncbi:MAG: hypothetical protein N2446_03470 [Elusimicrobiales bacterium]|nr:hypothetical protein [Elusimicrobiales bacterium]